MILYFSHIGFTEALTFIAPVFVSTTGLLRAPGVGRQARTFGPVGRRRKIAGAWVWGGVVGRGRAPLSKRAAGAALECFDRGARPLLPTRPKSRRSFAAQFQLRPRYAPPASPRTRLAPEAGADSAGVASVSRL